MSRRSARTATFLAALLVLLLVPSAGAIPRIDESWEDFDASPYADGEAIGPEWIDVWNGGGTTEIVAADGHGQVLQLTPGYSTDLHTFSALTVSEQTFENSDISAELRTVRQLKGEPNTWEVGWLLVRYHVDSCQNSAFYYLILKQASGWELGKTYSDEACVLRQHFLATGGGRFPIGQWHTPRLITSGNTIAVYNGSTMLGVATDYGVIGGIYTSGSVGLYTEDAAIQFDTVTVIARWDP